MVKHTILLSLLLFSCGTSFAGKGNGPATAWLLYSLTKGTAYGVGVAALGTGTVIAGGGLAGAAAGAGFAATTLGAGTVTSLTAGAIAGAGAASTAAAVEVSTAFLMASGSIAGATAAIETASLGAFAFGLALPLP